MKAAFIQSTGPVEHIQFGDQPDPQPASGQVRIRVAAASVNPIDLYVRSGLVQFDLPRPFFPGCDAAGVIDQLGEGVTEFAVGDRVWCTNQGLLGRQGTAAEFIVVDSPWCFPLPEDVPFTDAAAVALVGITAHLGLFREADLQPGETVLVIGGSGGVGSMVVQMAKAAGATVIATAGSDKKGDLVKSLGADHVINYKSESIAEAAARYAPEGVNVFWETRREPDFDLAVSALAPRGRMILMAGRDARPEFPVGSFYVKECSLHGFVMFKATPLEMKKAANEMIRWMQAGSLKALIGKQFPLSQTAEAHRLQEAATLVNDGGLVGKIVLTVDR